MRTIFFLFFFSLVACPSALAYQEHVDEACKRFNVPKKLVLSIIDTESAYNPWAVNVQGTPYHMKTREAALKVANAAWAAGKSFDVGRMQINSFWLKKWGLTPEYVIEPRRNIIIGTWILSKEIERFGLTWKAIGSYHTRLDKNPGRAADYAWKVIHKMQRK